MTNCPNFASEKSGHDVTEHFEEGGCHVTCDKPSTLKLGRTKNTWTDRTGIRMSQGQIVTTDGSLGGQIVWVELSRGQFVGGRIIKAPYLGALVSFPTATIISTSIHHRFF